jgi:hypothetical protein
MSLWHLNDNNFMCIILLATLWSCQNFIGLANIKNDDGKLY